MYMGTLLKYCKVYPEKCELCLTTEKKYILCYNLLF